MKKLCEIFFANYEKYDGKNAIVFLGEKVVKGKLSYCYDKLYFCCDDPNFNGVFCHKRYGYIYSWHLSPLQCLDGIALEDGEELDIPELRFSKLSVSGSGVNFKISDEIYEKLKALKELKEISLLEDFVINFDSYSRFICGRVNFKISERNTDKTIDFYNKCMAKKAYKRFLSYYLPKVEMEGIKYKVAVPCSFNASNIIFQNKIIIEKEEFIDRATNFCLNKYIDEFFKEGFVLPVKAPNKEEYIQKAVKYIYKLGCKLFRIKKDDCNDLILTNINIWFSKKGTKYINARIFDDKEGYSYDWVKDSDCIQVYDDGINGEPHYYVNNDTTKRKTFVSVSGRLYLLFNKTEIEGVYMDTTEVDTYAFRDELTLQWF